MLLIIYISVRNASHSTQTYEYYISHNLTFKGHHNMCTIWIVGFCVCSIIDSFCFCILFISASHRYLLFADRCQWYWKILHAHYQTIPGQTIDIHSEHSRSTLRWHYLLQQHSFASFTCCMYGCFLSTTMKHNRLCLFL